MPFYSFWFIWLVGCPWEKPKRFDKVRYLPSRSPVLSPINLTGDLLGKYLTLSNRFRGTQRICSSLYLFPRGILLAGKVVGVPMSWLGNLSLLKGQSWNELCFCSIARLAWWWNFEKVRWIPPPPLWRIDLRPFATPSLTYDVENCRFPAYWLRTLQLAGKPTNLIFLTGKFLVCLAGKKEQIIFSQQYWKTPENALITFIFINWGIIIYFSTNWSLGAPVV